MLDYLGLIHLHHPHSETKPEIAEETDRIQRTFMRKAPNDFQERKLTPDHKLGEFEDQLNNTVIY